MRVGRDSRLCVHCIINGVRSTSSSTSVSAGTPAWAVHCTNIEKSEIEKSENTCTIAIKKELRVLLVRLHEIKSFRTIGARRGGRFWMEMLPTGRIHVVSQTQSGRHNGCGNFNVQRHSLLQRRSRIVLSRARSTSAPRVRRLLFQKKKILGTKSSRIQVLSRKTSFPNTSISRGEIVLFHLGNSDAKRRQTSSRRRIEKYCRVAR